MDIQGIRYFTEICREGSFTKAARNCFVSEPALSRKIKQLEREWGIALFTRTTHSVTLTEQGKALWGEAEKLLAQYEALQKKACSLRGRRALTIGYSSQGERVCLEKAVRLASGRLPVDIELQLEHSVECVRRLQNGRLDAALLTKPMLEEGGNLEGVRLRRCGIGAFLPAEWALAREKEISIRQLAACPIVTFPRRVAPGTYDRMISLAKEAGVTLNVVAEVTNTAPFRILIEEEKEAGLMLDSSRIIESETLKWTPIREFAGQFDLMLAWRAGHPLADLLRRLGKMYGSRKA